MRGWHWPLILVVAMLAAVPQLRAQTPDGGTPFTVPLDGLPFDGLRLVPKLGDSDSPLPKGYDPLDRGDAGPQDTSDAGPVVNDDAGEASSSASDGGPSATNASPSAPSTAGPSDAGPSDAGPSDAGPSDAVPIGLGDDVNVQDGFDPATPDTLKSPAGTNAPPLPGEPTIEYRLDPSRCISPEELERAALGNKREAFGTSSIPLGPFFWASRDRTLVQAMLIYWRYLDVEERSRLEFLFPFYLKACSPQDDTFVGSFGLWGHRTDALGTAGYIGPYLYRRDIREQSDVVFPVYWWLRGEREHTMVAGPWYDFERSGKRRFGLVPFYFGGREKTGGFFDVTPVFAQWGDSYERNFWALQTWGKTTPTAWEVRSFPFYFGGQSRGNTGDDDGRLGSSYYHLVPPLLTFMWGEQTARGEVSRVLIGVFGDFVSPDGHDTVLFPLALWGEGAPLIEGASPTFGRLLWETLDDISPFQLAPRANAQFSYQLAPFFLHLEDVVTTDGHDDSRDRWAFGPGYFGSTTEGGWDLGVVPLYFEGWESEAAASRRGIDLDNPTQQRRHYRVVPPLLYGHFADGDAQTTFFAQTYLSRTGTAYDFGSIPFYFRGRAPDDDDSWYDIAPLVLNFHWGDQGGDNHIIGPAFSAVTARGFDHGIFPFYFGGETAPGHQRASAFERFEDLLFNNRLPDDNFDEARAQAGIPTDHYRVVPPLLYAHFGDGDGERTFLAQSYFFRDDDSWDFGSIPFAFFGRQDSEAQEFYDVIPPLLFARWGDRHATQLIAGPWYDFRLDSLFFADVASRHFGVAPFLFAGRVGKALARDDEVVDATDPYFAYHFGPGYLHLGFEEFNLLLAGQTGAAWDDESWGVLSFPFYFGLVEDERPRGAGLGRQGANWTHIVPPLLTYVGGSEGQRLANGDPDPRSEDGAWSTWITGPLWYAQTERGFDTSVLPLFAFGRSDDGPEGFAPAGLPSPRKRPFLTALATGITEGIFGETARDAVFGPKDRGFSYHVIPPLAYGHLATATHRRTVFLQSYLSRSETGYDVGSAPFFFHGRTTNAADNGAYYDVIPPLAFAAWGNDAETRWWFLQTHYGSEEFAAHLLDDGTQVAAASAWRVWSFPFAFFGADTRAAENHYYAVVPLLGFAHFGDDKSSNTVVGPYFDLENATGRDFGFAPFYLGGEGEGGGSPISIFAKRSIVAPLLGDEAAAALMPDRGHHYRLVPPLLYAHVGTDDEGLTLFGSAYYRRSVTGWDAGAFPLVFAGGTTAASDDDFGYAFAPLLLSGFFQEGNNRTTVVGPWFDIHTNIGDDEEFRAFGLLPIAGGYSSPTSHLFVGPAFANWGGARDDHWWVLQTFYSDQIVSKALAESGLDASTLESVIADGEPLLARTRFYSVPFVFYEHAREVPPGTTLDAVEALGADVVSSSLFVPPLLTWWQHDATSHHLVAGPWFDFENEHGRDFGLVPFYFEGASAGTGRSPLWRWAQTLREDLWGPPDDSAEWPIPLGDEMTTTAAGTSHYRVIPALAYLHFGDETMHRTVFGPSWLFDDQDGWNAGVFPAYFGRRSEKYGEHDVIPPLLFARWREAKRNAGGLWAGPFIGWDAPTYSEAMVLGLFYGGWMTPNDRGYVEEGPLTGFVRRLPLGQLLAGELGDDGGWWIAPPFGAHRSHQGGSATLVLQSWWIEEHNATHFGSAPFFFHGRERDAAGNTIGFYDVVPPALFGIWGDNDETNLFVGQTFASISEHHWKVWSAPFYFGGRRELEWAAKDVPAGAPAPVAYHHLIPLLGTFFWGDDVAQEERALIAPFLSLWLNNPADSFLLVGPFTRYDDKRTGDFDQALWPVWFSGQTGESYYDLVLPFGGAWGDAAQQSRFFLTAFESTSANGDSTRGILPFYYSQRRYKDRQLASSFDMITPAYFAWGQANEERRVFVPTLTYSSTVGDEDFLIAPLVYHLENQAETNTIVFPFYWHFRRAEAGAEIFDAHVASGVWWDFAWPNEGKRLQVAPGYVRFDAPDEEFHIAGPISWSVGKGDEADAWSFHVFPFFSAWSYHPGHFKWRALLFAAGYEREERKDLPPKEQWMFLGIKTDAE